MWGHLICVVQPSRVCYDLYFTMQQIYKKHWYKLHKKRKKSSFVARTQRYLKRKDEVTKIQCSRQAHLDLLGDKVKIYKKRNRVGKLGMGVTSSIEMQAIFRESHLHSQGTACKTSQPILKTTSTIIDQLHACIDNSFYSSHHQGPPLPFSIHHLPVCQDARYSAINSTLFACPSASPVLTFFPVFCIVLRTFS